MFIKNTSAQKCAIIRFRKDKSMLITEPNTILLAKPNKKIEKIYEGCYSDIFQRLKSTLEKYHEVHILDLPDIWIRDFAPFFTDKKAIPLLYKPPYQSFSKSEQIQSECLKHFHDFPIPLPIRFDGGNLIANRQGIGIATKKPLELNNISQKEMNLLMAELFGIQQMIWLPYETGDTIAHIDGMMQFLDDTTLIINEPNSKELKKCHQILQQACPHIKLVDIPCKPTYEKYYGWESVKGVYVNFLQTSKIILLPVYDMPTDEEVLNIIQNHTHKPVILINATKISKFGGSIHCLTNGY